MTALFLLFLVLPALQRTAATPARLVPIQVNARTDRTTRR
jgi:hypothetical protein